MSRVPFPRVAALAAVMALWGGHAQASLYTLDGATFAEDFSRRDAFTVAAGRFDTPYDTLFDESTRNKNVPAQSSYLAQAVRTVATASRDASSSNGSAIVDAASNGLPLVSFAQPAAAAPDVRAFAAAAATNLGSYQGNVWSLMTASLAAPSGNSLYGFAKANFADIPFEPPATVPLPGSGLLFAGGLLAFGAWAARARQMAR